MKDITYIYIKGAEYEAVEVSFISDFPTLVFDNEDYFLTIPEPPKRKDKSK